VAHRATPNTWQAHVSYIDDPASLNAHVLFEISRRLMVCSGIRSEKKLKKWTTGIFSSTSHSKVVPSSSKMAPCLTDLAVIKLHNTVLRALVRGLDIL